MTDMTPDPESRAPDPIAVALANGSLLSAGYVKLGRIGTALATGTATLGIVITLVATRSAWMELVLVGWWAAMVRHGWLLALESVRPITGRRAWRQRAIAVGVAVSVLLVIGLLRWEAADIDADLAEARLQGDCVAVRKAVDQVWFGHRLVDAGMTARADDTAAACDRIETAQADFDKVLSVPGDDASLTSGFDQLYRVLIEKPGHEWMVKAALDRFLDRLPADTGCDTATIADEIGKQAKRSNELDRAATIVPEIKPAALLQCGDEQSSANELDGARAQYRQLLEQYPRHQLAGQARKGIWKTQLAEVKELGSLYCDKPVAYGGAPRYRKGVNRAVIHGNSRYLKRLPGTWRTANEALATLIVCTEPADFGAAVDRCFYQPKPSAFGRGQKVTFHKVAIRVRAFELRTGKRVLKAKVSIPGRSCPKVLHHARYTDFGGGFRLDPEQHVKPSTAQVRAAFGRIIVKK